MKKFIFLFIILINIKFINETRATVTTTVTIGTSPKVTSPQPTTTFPGDPHSYTCLELDNTGHDFYGDYYYYFPFNVDTPTGPMSQFLAQSCGYQDYCSGEPQYQTNTFSNTLSAALVDFCTFCCNAWFFAYYKNNNQTVCNNFCDYNSNPKPNVFIYDSN
jgi:hypothetical protein